MSEISVSIGSNSIINASNASSIVLNGSDNNFAMMLSKTLQFIYTTVKNNISSYSLVQKDNINYNVFNLYGSGFTVYEFRNFLQSRGYQVLFKQLDGVTNVSNQTYADDSEILANMYDADDNVNGIKYININWNESNISSGFDYSIIFSTPGSALPPYEGEVTYPTI